MPRSPDPDLQKHTLFLRAGDYAFLRRYAAEDSAAPIIRALVSRYVDDLRHALEGTPLNDR